jgi:GH18 family chitinase
VSVQEQNAIQAANQYLEFMPFSRKGLIQQLSSTAGDGYPLAVATAAVDSLTVNYNDQAAKSAAQYLQTMSFSCNGLIQQLSSDAGAGFTQAQAVYGAGQTGIC